MELRIPFAAFALAGGLLFVQASAYGQQVNQELGMSDPSGLASLQPGNPLNTLSLLQAPSFHSTTQDSMSGPQAGGLDGSSLGSALSGPSAIGFSEVTEPIRGLKSSNAVVWSDNRGTWKSEPPGDACMLQSSSSINANSCN
jgi:hypothetical protein